MRSKLTFHRPGAEAYCWEQRDPVEALRATTHLGICAHQDDLEILALHGILECFQQQTRAFSGLVVTDGAGSSRDFEYAHFTDEQMRVVRRKEQRKAAHVGEYAVQILLDHPSARVKDPGAQEVVDDLVRVLELARPQVVYTHNLCDKHDTHVAVALRTISALRCLPPELRPTQVIGCEVWTDLDWLPDRHKIAMDVSSHPNLSAALLGVFDSQVAGGKRYDLAAAGRRRAHATFSESHGVDRSEALIYGMDLTPLLAQPNLDPVGFAAGLIEEFLKDSSDRIRSFAGS